LNFRIQIESLAENDCRVSATANTCSSPNTSFAKNTITRQYLRDVLHSSNGGKSRHQGCNLFLSCTRPVAGVSGSNTKGFKQLCFYLKKTTTKN